jgi:hypothetical protein
VLNSLVLSKEAVDKVFHFPCLDKDILQSYMPLLVRQTLTIVEKVESLLDSFGCLLHIPD